MDGYVKVARLDELPPGRMKAVRIEDEDIAIYNVGGSVYAGPDACTHQNYPLTKGELRDRIVTCPLHQWKYDVVSGRNVANPAIHLRRYEVKVERGDILVRRVPLPPPPPLPPPSLSRDDV